MNGTDSPARQRLRFLAETVTLEAHHLALTDSRLFVEPFDAARAALLKTDVDLAERVDAFVIRYGRLQDTLADKMLPALLDELAEPLGSAIDNLNRAERLGFFASVEQWIKARRLRNRMVHEYVRDLAELAAALNAGHTFVPLLLNAAASLGREVQQRFGAQAFPTAKGE